MGVVWACLLSMLTQAAVFGDRQVHLFRHWCSHWLRRERSTARRTRLATIDDLKKRRLHKFTANIPGTCLRFHRWQQSRIAFLGVLWSSWTDNFGLINAAPLAAHFLCNRSVLHKQWQPWQRLDTMIYRCNPFFLGTGKLERGLALTITHTFWR